MKLPSNNNLTEQARRAVFSFDRKRIINYAFKRGITFHQAMFEIARLPLELQSPRIDEVVDEQYHSSQRPKMEEVSA